MVEDVYLILKDGPLKKNDLLEQISEESQLLLDDMLKNKEIINNNGMLSLSSKILKCQYGRISRLTDHFALVSIDEDILKKVYEEDLHGALLNDVVLIRDINDYRSSEVLYILKRGNESLLFEVYINNGKISLVNKEIAPRFFKFKCASNHFSLKTHDLVLGRIKAYKSYSCDIEIEKKINRATAPLDEINLIFYKNQVDLDFPYEVNEEAYEIPTWVNNKDLKNRVDFRDHIIVTIDGDDAKDFDDAVEASLLPDGNIEIGVHIADVSYYVSKGSPLDKEAKNRSQSIYAANRVIPMLPIELSNGICSLNPHVDRLVKSVIFKINKKGEVYDSKIERGVIRSSARLTYKEVNRFFKRHSTSENITKPIENMLLVLKKAAHIIEKKYKAKGALDIESIEHVFTLETNNEVKKIGLRKQDIGEKLIENLMISANEIVAKTLYDLDLLCLYRVHEAPQVKKIKMWEELSTSFGYPFSLSSFKVAPKELQKHLSSIKDKEKKLFLSNQLLRALAKAKYDVKPLGHFGLALSFYCHFTSPIRRYPDLLVHRLLDEYYFTNKPNNNLKAMKRNLETEAYYASYKERKILKIERDVDAYLCASYMKKYIGSSFEGIISGFSSRGMFVELKNGISGCVPFEYIGRDVYYDEERFCLVSRRGIMYRLGEEIKVSVETCDTSLGQITFSLLKSSNKFIIEKKGK